MIWHAIPGVSVPHFSTASRKTGLTGPRVARAAGAGGARGAVALLGGAGGLGEGPAGGAGAGGQPLWRDTWIQGLLELGSSEAWKGGRKRGRNEAPPANAQRIRGWNLNEPA